MFIYSKGNFKALTPEIVFDRWDEPVIRTREDGTEVKGRPSRGFGDFSFTYAGKHMEPEAWDALAWMPAMKTLVEQVTHDVIGKEVSYDFCLAGFYPDGNTGIMHHSDTVPTTEDIVCSISFGAPRLFVQRQYESAIKTFSDTSDIVTDGINYTDDFFMLESGDVIFFDGESQMTSTHDVPALHGVGPRINLTFRTGMEANRG